MAKVEDHIARTEAAGGRVLTGGHRHNLGGRFFQPTVMEGGDDVLFREEETFGPLAPVFAFDDEADVVARANASEYGLAAFLFTRDLDRAMRVGRALEAGVIGVNAGLVSNRGQSVRRREAVGLRQRGLDLRDQRLSAGALDDARVAMSAAKRLARRGGLW